MGLFPILGAIFTQLPKPVVGGVTLLMFATVATAGIRIYQRSTLPIAIS
ncbi:solute carrier family 23 protein [Psychrobacter sp. WY6]|nr:solute carrier family 23 protein [Psychrobacter sp. WY6]